MQAGADSIAGWFTCPAVFMMKVLGDAAPEGVRFVRLRTLDPGAPGSFGLVRSGLATYLVAAKRPVLPRIRMLRTGRDSSADVGDHPTSGPCHGRSDRQRLSCNSGSL